MVYRHALRQGGSGHVALLSRPRSYARVREAFRTRHRSSRTEGSRVHLTVDGVVGLRQMFVSGPLRSTNGRRSQPTLLPLNPAGVRTPTAQTQCHAQDQRLTIVFETLVRERQWRSVDILIFVRLRRGFGSLEEEMVG